MAGADEYFPRGKGQAGVTSAKSKGDVPKASKRKVDDKLTNLFVASEEKRSEKKVKKSKNTLTPEEQKTLAGKRRSQEKRFAVVPLSYDQIVEGMLSLGIITKIRDHEMSVSLPGRTSGTISITNVSTPYLKTIEKHAEGKAVEDEDLVIYTLRDMFRVGQIVVVKVKDVQRTESKTKVVLSLNPEDLYNNYSTTVLKEDLVMIAAVASKEDHGFIVDVGINGARCFLPKDDADKFVARINKNQPLGVGQLVYCKIKKINFHRLMANITFTAIPKPVQFQRMDDVFGLNYSTLMPGMLVDAIVMETQKSGLMAHCVDLDGLIHQDHMENIWTTPESLQVGSTVPARVLYMLPNLTTPYLTLQADAIPLTWSSDKTDKDKLGAKLKVKIVRIENRGIIVRFTDGDKGFIPLNHIGDESLLSEEDIEKKYKINSYHECRVFQYSHIERIYLCSFKKDALECDIVHFEQALPGKRVTCTILRWNKGGATVKYGSGMHAFIPNIMFKTASMDDAAKEKLIGATMKARIMERDSNMDKIILTVRKELVNSSGAVISSLDEAKNGMICDAMIRGFNNVGVYVKTIGGVEGFIPQSKLSKVRIPNVRDAFHIGELIKCKVLEIVPEKNHMLMTAFVDDNDDDENNEIKRKKKGERKRKVGVDVEDNSEQKPSKKKRKRKQKKPKLEEDADNDSVKQESSDEETLTDTSNTVKSKPENQTSTLILPESSSFWDTTEIKEEKSSEDEDDSEVQTPKRNKKVDLPVVAQSNVMIETDSISPADRSDTVELIEKFEKGIVSSPDDPAYWIKLMTHYNSMGRIDKARGISKQALNAINYRDEKAKLKIWGAIFQLEVKYGTEDTIRASYSDALLRSDPFECMKLMALVYDKADRYKDAERIYCQLIKQFRLEPDAWIRFATFYYLRHKADSARDLLTKVLHDIEVSKKVHLVTKFALLEMHHGEQTRGESMFDRTLAQYPQRADVWLVYVNALIKLGDFEQARSVFHRAFEFSWNPRKVVSLLKRFQEFETSHGTEETRVEFRKYALKALNLASNVAEET